ncbi:MAG TPA: hypothetical protein VMS77_03245 [Conexivisphaerales archaeon]|nr:hypothetical protein [Conexivisphaerales archaeon]
MSLKLFSVFTVLMVVMAVPAVYQVVCPECHGEGVIHIQVVGMNYIRLVNYSTFVVNTVRLGCGTYAVYTSNVTLLFSNSASVPINATVLYYTSYNESGVLISKYPLTFAVPANSTRYQVTLLEPSQVSIQNAPVLPVLSFSVQLAQASNATLSLPCPKCHGHKTIPLIQLFSLFGGQASGGG